MREQSGNSLKKLRSNFYDLLGNCVEGPEILRQLTMEILKRGLREESVKEVIHIAAEHERTIMCGSKTLIHL